MSTIAATTIGVGLSGGIDSTMAAWKLLQAGHKVIGYTMVVTDGSSIGEDAQAAADWLGIPLRTIDLRDRFRDEILTPFVEAYSHGLTPSPCVWCNRKLKFGLLKEAMLADGCECIATGHYAQLDNAGDRIKLRRGADPIKDQSYFLSQLDPSQLHGVVFPMGGMLKSDVRRLSAELGAPAAKKDESQDLCFMNESIADFIGLHNPALCRPGWIVDLKGKRLGRHTGAFQYTRGQRRGLGLGGGPWFVADVNIEENKVVVAHDGEVASTSCRLTDMKYFADKLLEIKGEAQIRYRMKPQSATIKTSGDDTAELIFDAPVSSITPGQLAVLYNGDQVIASGWIAK